MNFSVALDRIKFGQPMTRESWNDPGTYVHRLNYPENEKINIRTSSGTDTLWSPTIDDIMANDWQDTLRVE